MRGEFAFEPSTGRVNSLLGHDMKNRQNCDHHDISCVMLNTL